MVHNKQCAKIEDRDERTNCLNQIPTPQEVEQGQAAFDAKWSISYSWNLESDVERIAFSGLVSRRT